MGTVFDSALLMMDYLVHNPLNERISNGAGLWLGRSRDLLRKKFSATVTGVDLDAQVFPYLEVLAEINDVEIDTQCADFKQLKAKELGAHNVIVGSDICFLGFTGRASGAVGCSCDESEHSENHYC